MRASLLLLIAAVPGLLNPRETHQGRQLEFLPNTPAIQKGNGPTVKGKNGDKEGKTAHVEMKTTWTMADPKVEKTPDPIQLTCDNDCVNYENSSADACEANCDEMCTQKHHLLMKGTSNFISDNVIKGAADVQAAATKAGFKGSVSTSKLLDAGRDCFDRAVKAATMDLDLDVPHFNKQGCEDRWRSYGYTSFDVKMTVSMTLVDDEGGSVALPSATYIVGHMLVPESEPRHDYSEFYCPCFPYDSDIRYNGPYDEIAKVPIAWTIAEEFKPVITARSPNNVPGLKIRTIKNRGVSFLRESDPVRVTVDGVDVNTIEVTVVNGTGNDYVFTVPAGTVFEGDKEHQRMMALENGLWMIHKMSTSWNCGLGLSLDLPSKATFRMSAACIEMQKEPPHPGLPYKADLHTPDGLANLGQQIANESMHGVWDQTKVWIYTDHAALAAIQNRLLFPRVTAGIYLNALADVAQYGGVDVTSQDFAGCLSPDLILGGDAYDGPTRWLINTYTKKDPKALASAIEGGLESLKKDLAGLAPKAKLHVAQLAMALEESEDAGLQQAGLDLLAAVPDGDRGTLVSLGGLKSLACLLSSSDDAIANKAIEVEKGYETALSGSPLKAAFHTVIESR